MENLFLFLEQQYVLVISLGALLFLFYRHESARGGAKLTCQEVIKAVNSDQSVLLDVRETKEYDAGHIVDSIHIPHGKVKDSIKQLEKHRQKQIIVVDKMGQHSGEVVKTLKAQEFDVVRLRGGITEWQQDNLPLVKE